MNHPIVFRKIAGVPEPLFQEIVIWLPITKKYVPVSTIITYLSSSSTFAGIFYRPFKNGQIEG